MLPLKIVTIVIASLSMCFALPIGGITDDQIHNGKSHFSQIKYWWREFPRLRSERSWLGTLWQTLGREQPNLRFRSYKLANWKPERLRFPPKGDSNRLPESYKSILQVSIQYRWSVAVLVVKFSIVYQPNVLYYSNAYIIPTISFA
jgi:hypothetical protein